MSKSIIYAAVSVTALVFVSNAFGADLVREKLEGRSAFHPIHFRPIHFRPINLNISRPSIKALPSSFAWQGFYVGAELGRSISEFHNTIARSSIDNRGDQASIDAEYSKPSGIIGGVYGGYNVNMGHNIIAGIDGGLDLSRSKAEVTKDNKVTASYKENYTGAVRGRLGYDFGRVLPYIAGGASFLELEAAKGQIEHNKLNGNTIKSKFAVGYNMGGGVDYALTDNVLVRADYRYQDFKEPPVQYLEDNTLSDKGAEDISLKSHNIRFGLAYKF